MIKLACLVRAHKRSKTLKVVLSELQRYRSFDGLELMVFVFLDRPTEEVKDVAYNHEAPDFVTLTSVPILDTGRERFLEAQNSHLRVLESLQDWTPDWVYVGDDDAIFEPTKITTELARALSNTEIDAWYVPCVFLQDKPDSFNPARQHESIRLYRHRPRARFTGKRMLSVPDAVHDDAVISGRYARFPVPWLEYGGASPQERKRVIEAYLAAGKDDAFVRALESKRRLEFPRDYAPGYGPWTDLSSPDWFEDQPVGLLPQDSPAA